MNILDSRPKIELVEKVKQEQKMYLSKDTIFNRLENEANRLGHILRARTGGINHKERNYLIFHQIPEVKCYDDLEREMALISDKKSNLPRNKRDLIKHLFLYINILYDEYNERDN